MVTNSASSTRDRDLVLAENVRLSLLEAPIYDRNHFEIFHPYEQHRLRRHLTRYSSAQRVLDVGAGTGNVVTKLGAPVRVALDLSPEMLGQLQHADPDVACVVGLAEALPFPDSAFDVVVIYSTVHHLADETAFAELRRVLRPGGKLLIEHEEAFQRGGWRAGLYGVMGWHLRTLAAVWYWRRPAADCFAAYRQVCWPYSDTVLRDVDFVLTDGGHPNPVAVEAELARLGMATRRRYHLLVPLPMSTPWQELIDRCCARWRFGHFAIEATR